MQAGLKLWLISWENLSTKLVFFEGEFTVSVSTIQIMANTDTINP